MICRKFLYSYKIYRPIKRNQPQVLKLQKKREKLHREKLLNYIKRTHEKGLQINLAKNIYEANSTCCNLGDYSTFKKTCGKR